MTHATGAEPYLEIKICLADFTRALSLALDLAEYQTFMQHGHRVTYMALRLGKMVGMDSESLTRLYFAGLLHDIGLTSMGGMRLLHDEQFLRGHTAVGKELVLQLPIPGIAELVLCHHENFDGSGVYGHSGESIALGARILSMADSIDAVGRNATTMRQAREDIAIHVSTCKNSRFDPYLSDTFAVLSKQDKFWLDLEGRNLPFALAALQPSNACFVDQESIVDIGRVFAKIIDSKSRFTANHSRGLAELLRRVAESSPLLSGKERCLYTAGLLHDLGKMVVPTELLEKPGTLTPEEYTVMKSHVYYSKLILNQVPGLETIASWAGNHHERLDGRGYAERVPGQELTLEERLVAVCDVYQALTEERPYRSGESPAKVFGIIESMVKSGGLCSDAARMVANVVL